VAQAPIIDKELLTRTMKLKALLSLKPRLQAVSWPAELEIFMSGSVSRCGTGMPHTYTRKTGPPPGARSQGRSSRG
jgi:hypothetical protein